MDSAGDSAGELLLVDETSDCQPSDAETVLETPLRSWIKLVIPGAISSFCRSSLGMVATAFLGHLQQSSDFPGADSTDFLAASALTLSWFAATNMRVLCVGLDG